MMRGRAVRRDPFDLRGATGVDGRPATGVTIAVAIGQREASPPTNGRDWGDEPVRDSTKERMGVGRGAREGRRTVEGGRGDRVPGHRDRPSGSAAAGRIGVDARSESWFTPCVAYRSTKRTEDRRDEVR